MWNRRKLVLAVIAICTGGSILFLEAVLLGADLWSMRLASLREPIDLVSESCDVPQLEEMDVVKGTIRVLYGSYDYHHDSFRDPYFQDITFYYVLPVQTAGIVMVAGSISVLIQWRRRRRRQTHITIGNAVYEKTQLTRVNQLVEHIEMMQAVYELSRITGLELPQAEKVVRKWYDYWY